MTGRTARVTSSGPKKFVSSCARTSASGISSKVPAMKFPALLTSTSIRPNRSTAAATAACALARVGDVELDDEQVVVRADGGADGVGGAAGRDDGVTGGQGGAGQVDAQAAARAGDEEDLLVAHGQVSFVRGRPAGCLRGV